MCQHCDPCIEWVNNHLYLIKYALLNLYSGIRVNIKQSFIECYLGFVIECLVIKLQSKQKHALQRIRAYNSILLQHISCVKAAHIRRRCQHITAYKYVKA